MHMQPCLGNEEIGEEILTKDTCKHEQLFELLTTQILDFASSSEFT